jgi:hypothetical protein
MGEHTFEYVVDKEPTETEVGYRHRECTVCGYKKAQVEIQPTGTPTPPAPPVDDTPTEEPKDDPSTLSPGAVVAIVVAAVAVGGPTIIALVWFVVKKKRLDDLVASVKEMTEAMKKK